MKNVTRHVGILRHVERLPSSKNGNPRYRAFVDQGSGTGWWVRTAVDSSHGYSVTNFADKRVVVTIGTHFGAATLDSIRLASADD